MSSPIDSADGQGDRWSTLILSDAFMGSRCFGEFQARLEVSPVTLSDRLNLFVDTQLLSRESVGTGARRQEYRLTPKGLDFFSVTAMINDWAARWLSDHGQSGLSLVHGSCGATLQPRFTCNTCNEQLERREVTSVGRVPDAPVPSVGR